MNKVIVTTTIYPPSIALEKFASFRDWKLVVVGDKKTPPGWRIDNAIYLNAETQEKIDPVLSDLLGWNCVQRRNMGFLYAYKELKADIIATVDDDNIPYPEWGESLYLGKEHEVQCFNPLNDFFDPLSVTNHKDLWHRGYPIQLVSTKNKMLSSSVTKFVPKIQADLWNGDPDIDAIERFIYAPECNFSEKCFPFTASKAGPFDSQNTFVHKDVLSSFFMFPFIGRMDDIWASYFVQALGHRVIYNKATVYQARNPQNLTKNMVHEFLGYEKTLDFATDLFKGVDSSLSVLKRYLPDNSYHAYRRYNSHFLGGDLYKIGNG